MDTNKLKGHIPDKVLAELPAVMKQFSIDSPLRLSHFLAQTAHESTNFTRVEENLNYSAKRLLEVFPKYFNVVTAAQYANKPEAIGSHVYANRMGNGDEKSKTGFKFKGRGFLQLTGFNNYKSFSQFLPKGIVLTDTPEKVATDFPLLSAGWFWKMNNLNSTADKGSTLGVVTLVTKVINGGTHGIADRVSLFNKFYNILK
jgi:putative chitinase